MKKSLKFQLLVKFSWPPLFKATYENVSISFLIVIVKFGFFKIPNPPPLFRAEAEIFGIFSIEVAPKSDSLVGMSPQCFQWFYKTYNDRDCCFDIEPNLVIEYWQEQTHLQDLWLVICHRSLIVWKVSCPIIAPCMSLVSGARMVQCRWRCRWNPSQLTIVFQW